MKLSENSLRNGLPSTSRAEVHRPVSNCRRRDELHLSKATHPPRPEGRAGHVTRLPVTPKGAGRTRRGHRPTGPKARESVTPELLSFQRPARRWRDLQDYQPDARRATPESHKKPPGSSPGGRPGSMHGPALPRKWEPAPAGHPLTQPHPEQAAARPAARLPQAARGRRPAHPPPGRFRPAARRPERSAVAPRPATSPAGCPQAARARAPDRPPAG